MNYAQATLLGAVQGLTEFLPVSSSAHLALAPRFFRFPDPGLAFDVALHVGTLASVLVYFRRRWGELATAALRDPRGAGSRGLGLLALATAPAAAAGYLLEDLVESAFREPARIAGCLIAFSAAMWWAERKGHGERSWRESGPATALLVGAAQALALMPGVSRSGATVSAGLLLGLSRAEAAELSFLMSAPIIAGAALLKLRHLSLAQLDGPFLWAVTISAASGFMAVGLFIGLLPRWGLTPYVLYRVTLGLAALIAI